MILKSSTFVTLALCPLLCLFSCVDIPLDINLEYELDIEAHKINKIAQGITDKLLNLSVDKLTPAPGPDLPNPDDCKLLFNEWLEQQISQHRIPYKLILPSEYAANSKIKNIKKCNSVNIKKEIDEIQNTDYKDDILTEYFIIDFEEYRKTIDEFGECGHDILKPDQRRLDIKNMSLKVSDNNLNATLPKFNIYYTTRNIDNAELQTPQAEAELKKQGIIKLLAKSQAIPANFVGSLPLVLAKNQDKRRMAMDALSTLKPQILIIQEAREAKIETKNIGGHEYFLLPKGSAHLSFVIKADLSTKISDMLCYYHKIKRNLRAKE